MVESDCSKSLVIPKNLELPISRKLATYELSLSTRWASTDGRVSPHRALIGLVAIRKSLWSDNDEASPDELLGYRA